LRKFRLRNPVGLKDEGILCQQDSRHIHLQQQAVQLGIALARHFYRKIQVDRAGRMTGRYLDKVRKRTQCSHPDPKSELGYRRNLCTMLSLLEHIRFYRIA